MKASKVEELREERKGDVGEKKKKFRKTVIGALTMWRVVP